MPLCSAPRRRGAGRVPPVSGSSDLRLAGTFKSEGELSLSYLRKGNGFQSPPPTLSKTNGTPRSGKGANELFRVSWVGPRATAHAPGDLLVASRGGWSVFQTRKLSGCPVATAARPGSSRPLLALLVDAGKRFSPNCQPSENRPSHSSPTPNPLFQFYPENCSLPPTPQHQ